MTANPPPSAPSPSEIAGDQDSPAALVERPLSAAYVAGLRKRLQTAADNHACSVERGMDPGGEPMSSARKAGAQATRELHLETATALEHLQAENERLRGQSEAEAEYSWGLRAAKEAAEALAERLTKERDEARRALSSYQDEVWSSFGAWSAALGWGLTGAQPECFAMMDESVRELVWKRARVKELEERVRTYLEAVDAADAEAARADQPGASAFSSAPMVRMVTEREKLRAALPGGRDA